MKKLLALCTSALIAASIPGMAVSAMAEETTQTTDAAAQTTDAVAQTAQQMVLQSYENGLLTVSVPADQSWQEITDDSSCITISDGANTIIFNHYSTPDQLPQVASYDSQHEMAYEIAYSKSDISITLVGKITHTSDYASVKAIMDSINIDVTKIDANHPATHQVSTDSYSVKDVNYTAWVTASDGLCIREGGSTSSNFITTAPYASKLTVTGEVLKNGSDTGWRKVTTSDGTTGYCSGQFLSTTEVTAAAATPTPTPSDSFYGDYPSCVAIYCAGDLRYVYLMENGEYVDDDGNTYQASSNFTVFVRDNDGVTYSSAAAAGVDPSDWEESGSYDDDITYFTVTDEEGDTRTLTNGGSGDDYIDEYGVGYTCVDTGTWLSDEGIYYYE